MSPKAANWEKKNFKKIKNKNLNSCVIAAQQLWESSAIRSDSDPLHHCISRQALLQTEAIIDVK